jgi:hypothetical protein
MDFIEHSLNLTFIFISRCVCYIFLSPSAILFFFHCCDVLIQFSTLLFSVCRLLYGLFISVFFLFVYSYSFYAWLVLNKRTLRKLFYRLNCR